jgi:hypothetical protein
MIVPSPSGDEVLLALNGMRVNTICFYECKSNKDTAVFSSKTFVNYIDIYDLAVCFSLNEPSSGLC